MKRKTTLVNEDHAEQSPSLQGKEGGKEEADDFVFLGSKITWTVSAAI